MTVIIHKEYRVQYLVDFISTKSGQKSVVYFRKYVNSKVL